MTSPNCPEPLLPLGLRLTGRRVVVVGGGPVALRRVGALMAARARVTVVSPVAVAALEDLAERGQIQWLARPYEPGDLQGAWLAMACTADPTVNAQVLAAADEMCMFCLRADDASGASAWMPATGRTGRATVSVHGDRDPRAAAALRDAALDAVGAALRQDPRLRVRRWPDPAGSGAASGRVILVGGGPGDPELLTLKGFQALADADSVVVDRLAPLAVLDGLREGVEIIDVSKIPRGRFTPQEEINVIPGVTSAIAAPGLAGIPVTHRGLSQGFTVVSGHVAPGDPRSTLDWDALARGGTTLVVLMGVENLGSIVDAVVDAGLDVDTPVGCVMDGGLPNQKVVLTSLSKVAGSGPPPGLHSPAVIVIGAVAGFATG